MREATPDYAIAGGNYGRCGINGKHRDHSPSELERYRRGLSLFTARPSTVSVEEFLESQGEVESPAPLELRPWSIQIFHGHTDDAGERRRACTVFQCSAVGIGEAYAMARSEFPDEKLGAILPGYHARF